MGVYSEFSKWIEVSRDSVDSAAPGPQRKRQMSCLLPEFKELKKPRAQRMNCNEDYPNTSLNDLITIIVRILA